MIITDYSLDEKVFLTCYREYLIEKLEADELPMLLTSEELDEFCLMELEDFRTGKTKLTLDDEGAYSLEFL